jgi:catechol 2,3-dioxygenase-like lactoylglutathione lyase family enzyme
MIIGAHTIIQSKDAEADKAFLRDVLGLSGIDSGGGWLIFSLPPSEVAVHPSSQNDAHDLYLICDDIEAFVAEMSGKGVSCSPIQEQRWGRLIQLQLPGGGKLGVYQALHARPSTS